MSSGQKDTAGEWHRNAVGRPYRYLEIDGVQCTQWDHTGGRVVRRESPDTSTPRTPNPRNPSQTLPTNSEPRPRPVGHDSRNALDRNAPIATQARNIPYDSYSPEDHQRFYSLFPRGGSQHQQEDSYDEPGRPPPANRNHDPTGRHAAADSLPRNLAGAETHLPVQDTKSDQQNYSPGTKKVRRNTDRTYYLDRHGQPTLSVPATATRHEASPNHSSSTTEALIDQFNSMDVQSNVSRQGGSHRATRHSSALGASTEKAHGDTWISSRHVSDPREVWQSAGDVSANLSTRPEIPRHASLEASTGMRDEHRQSRERHRTNYPQDDNEDDYGDTSSFKSPQDLQRPLPPQQSGYRQSNNQSQRQPKRVAGEDSTVQPRTIINHGRRSSLNQWRMTKTAESNTGKGQTMDPRYRIRKDAKTFFVVGRVFAMLWHENAGNEGTDVSVVYAIGRFGEKVYSTIRRMVVVAEKHGHCICVPIATYGKQGTLKAGLSPADIEAHAVIYMVGTSSEADPGEKIVKNPIAVNPVDLDQKLHPKSRINFDRVYSVNHNVKVMHVGKVADESLHNLSLYYQFAHFRSA